MNPMVAASNAVGSSLPVAISVAILLTWLGVVISKRMSLRDPYSHLATVMIVSVVLHMLAAPAQIYVVDHFYNGVADWNRYVHQGALLSTNWRHGDFTTAGTGIRGLIGNGAVSVAGAVIMTVVGPDKLAAFFVAAWLAFVGTALFYRAFAVTFPRVDRRRYAILVFLFPSLIFWTADVSKEAVMLFALGSAAYGMALILDGGARGYAYAVAGGALALFIRPDELIILAIGFAVAMLVRGINSGDRTKARNPIGMLGAAAFVVAVVVVTGIYASHFVHSLTGSGLSTSALNKVSHNNQGTGAGFGSSNVIYSSSPIWYPRDVYTVLFDPLPVSAHSITQLFAALENTLVLVVVLLSLPRLRHLVRCSIYRPYVLAAFFYTAVFLYAFAALGNLGLIARERTLLLPFLFVLFAIPLAPKGELPYPWQQRRRQRRRVPEIIGVRPDEEDSDDRGAEWQRVDSSQWAADPASVDAQHWVGAEWVAET